MGIKKSAFVTLTTLKINTNRRCRSRWWSWWSWTPPLGWCCAAAAAVAAAVSHLRRRGRRDVTSGHYVTYAWIPDSRASTRHTHTHAHTPTLTHATLQTNTHVSTQVATRTCHVEFIGRPNKDSNSHVLMHCGPLIRFCWSPGPLTHQ